MTAYLPARLLSLTVAAILLGGCSMHRETVSEADASATAVAANIAHEAVAKSVPPPAPPAPVGLMAPAAAASASLDAIAISGSRMRASSETKATATSKSEREEARQQAQSGTLTAGDYDDLLNPRQYARYAEHYLQEHAQTGLPFVDTRTPVKIRVTGRDGQPVAFADVATIDNRGNTLRLPTAANGTAVFFPSLDELPERLQFSVDAKGSPSVQRTVDLARLGSDRTLTVELPIAGHAPAALDLLLAIDTTGSMGDELRYLQAELDSIIASLRRIRTGTDIRVGLVVYRDQGDEYVTRTVAFTRDLADLRRQLGEQRADGGGDYPEAVDRAFADANRFDWRKDATKVMLHVADAPPHDELADEAWEQARALRARGVHIVPVAASGVADEAQYLMRSMAALTQSRYIFLTDDSGVGLPHAEPDVPCYIVTRLDGLIERVVASLLTGHRVEPQADAVLRHTGDYDRGVCRSTRQPRIAQ
ncbi:vWA domain-containing protein [Thermomonas sp. HDW16]|uniref:vWA domain-containing protein n=1 Tax=Thermomonas sp. HDW16 TaxID=2714945 RepID=UPI001408ECE0|nr:vWA domain-containing protein [Thermomonas sp. HDW16]QIL21409.1 VWA domain-containing protein [Thermomonas sp. HDW16]